MGIRDIYEAVSSNTQHHGSIVVNPGGGGFADRSGFCKKYDTSYGNSHMLGQPPVEDGSLHESVSSRHTMLNTSGMYSGCFNDVLFYQTGFTG